MPLLLTRPVVLESEVDDPYRRDADILQQCADGVLVLQIYGWSQPIALSADDQAAMEGAGLFRYHHRIRWATV